MLYPKNLQMLRNVQDYMHQSVSNQVVDSFCTEKGPLNLVMFQPLLMDGY